MGMIDRIKNICLTPKTEWSVIDTETPNTASLITGYVLPLAAIGAVAGFVNHSVIGTTIPFSGVTFRTPMLMGLAMIVFTIVMAVVSVFVLSLIIDALAPSFGGQKSFPQALKVAVYAYTPAWIAGIFNIIPWVGWLLAFLLALYSLYLLFLGLPALMKNPEDKSIGYTIVVVICAIVLTVVIGLMSSMVLGFGKLASGVASGAAAGAFGRASSSDGVTIDKNSPLGKLEQFAKNAEEAGKKMDAAQKSGDPKAQAEAAAAALGAMFGGVAATPITIDQLKPLVPESIGAMKRTSISSDSGGAAGFNMSRVEAQYADATSGKSINLEVQDSGGAAGLLGIASWANIQSEREDQYKRSKTYVANGRTIKEEASKDPNGSSEYTVIVASRFIVTAKGNGVPFDQVKAAANGVDLGKLESMKDVGVKK
jgi:Yip1 domain